MIKTKQHILKIKRKYFLHEKGVEIKNSGVSSKNVVKSKNHWDYGQNPIGLQ